MRARGSPSIVVLGGGIAGLAAALALARDGHRVTVVERDPVSVGEPLESFGWERTGIPHFLQPHAFTPRGRKEMRSTLPDVFDAMGRRTTTPAWIEAIGGRPMDERSKDCAIIYYCRYYRVRNGQTLADGPWIPSPRGDLGYAAFSTFLGDNRTFCALVATPPADQALKVLREARAFEAATRTMPALDAWTNPGTSEPITPVLPMGSLQNTLRSLSDGRPPVVGLVSVGDALCHTDPVASLGPSFALIHARLLAAAIRDSGSDMEAVALAFDALARPGMDEPVADVGPIAATRA